MKVHTAFAHHALLTCAFSTFFDTNCDKPSQIIAFAFHALLTCAFSSFSVSRERGRCTKRMFRPCVRDVDSVCVCVPWVVEDHLHAAILLMIVCLCALLCEQQLRCVTGLCRAAAWARARTRTCASVQQACTISYQRTISLQHKA